MAPDRRVSGIRRLRSRSPPPSPDRGRQIRPTSGKPSLGSSPSKQNFRASVGTLRHACVVCLEQDLLGPNSCPRSRRHATPLQARCSSTPLHHQWQDCLLQLAAHSILFNLRLRPSFCPRVLSLRKHDSWRHKLPSRPNVAYLMHPTSHQHDMLLFDKRTFCNAIRLLSIHSPMVSMLAYLISPLPSHHLNILQYMPFFMPSTNYLQKSSRKTDASALSLARQGNTSLGLSNHLHFLLYQNQHQANSVAMARHRDPAV